MPLSAMGGIDDASPFIGYVTAFSVLTRSVSAGHIHALGEDEAGKIYFDGRISGACHGTDRRDMAIARRLSAVRHFAPTARREHACSTARNTTYTTAAHRDGSIFALLYLFPSLYWALIARHDGPFNTPSSN